MQQPLRKLKLYYYKSLVPGPELYRWDEYFLDCKPEASLSYSNGRLRGPGHRSADLVGTAQAVPSFPSDEGCGHGVL